MVILIGSILFEIGIGAFVAIKKSYIEDKIVDLFRNYEISYKNHNQFWDFWQKQVNISRFKTIYFLMNIIEICFFPQLECCGFNDANDWKGLPLPKSCCAGDLDTCTQTDPTFHKHGCDFEFREFFNGIFSNMVFIVILIIIFTVQV